MPERVWIVVDPDPDQPSLVQVVSVHSSEKAANVAAAKYEEAQGYESGDCQVGEYQVEA
jgi:hypothetical protein